MQVPGQYEALLARERKHHERWGGRSVYADPEDHSQGFFLRDRHLLDALEAGQPVVVRGHDLGGWNFPKVPLSAQQKDCPNYYTVTPDDRIVPADSPVDPIRPPGGTDDTKAPPGGSNLADYRDL
jgi:hypothetical protein